MSETNYTWIYIFSLIMGAILVIFANSGGLFNGIIIALGLLFIIPSLISLISYIVHRVKHKELPVGYSWVIIAAAAGGLILGILLVSMPDFFAHYLVYTFGVILIVCGLAQVMDMTSLYAQFKINRLFLMMPILTLICGVVIIVLGPERIETIVSMLAGIFLICYSINGFCGLLTRRKAVKKSAVATRE